MNRNLTRMKRISITCEQSVEQRVLDALKIRGVKSARVSSVRIEEFDGESAVDLFESQLQIDCLVTPDKVDGIVDAFTRLLTSKFELGFFVTDAEVLRPGIFCGQ